jgi:hypothetical protein
MVREMKKIILFIFIVTSSLFGQQNFVTPDVSANKFDIAAGMGVKAISISDVINYINSFKPIERENNISIAPEFYISPEMQISENLGLKLEYSYLIRTFDETIATGGSYSFTIAVNSPTVILHYLVKGNGYYFKLGGGLGYRFGSFSQKLISTDELTYSSKGVGLKVDVAGHTTLGGNLYAVIGAGLSADFMSDLKDDNGNYLTNLNKKFSLGSVGAGLSFGLSYYF